VSARRLSQRFSIQLTTENIAETVDLAAALLSASATALAHPGHEAIGDVLHVEYIFAAGIVVAAAFSAWKAIKQRRWFEPLTVKGSIPPQVPHVGTAKTPVTRRQQLYLDILRCPILRKLGYSVGDCHPSSGLATSQVGNRYLDCPTKAKNKKITNGNHCLKLGKNRELCQVC
jgi:hypothetical protein